EAARAGDGAWRVRAVIENDGWMPTNVTERATEKKIVREIEATVELPDGARLVTGTSPIELGQLDGRARATTMLADRGWTVDATDAVALCVPPDAQVALGVRAAEAGKPLLLEKPLGLDLPGAQRLADAIDANGVPNVVVLTNRFAAPVREFLSAACDFRADG